MSIKARKTYKKYTPYDKSIYAVDRALINQYGLRNKSAIRKVEAKVQKYRKIARGYASDSPIYQQVIAKLLKKGIISDASANLLALNIYSFLERNLAVIVSKTYNFSILQSRQMITSGRIYVNSIRVTRPSSLIDITSVLQVK